MIMIVIDPVIPGYSYELAKTIANKKIDGFMTFIEDQQHKIIMMSLKTDTVCNIIGYLIDNLKFAKMKKIRITADDVHNGNEVFNEEINMN